jgi:hypothetical protein
MLVDSFLELYRGGILRRKVYRHPGLQRLLNDGRIGEEVTPATLEVLAEAGISLSASAGGLFKRAVEFRERPLLLGRVHHPPLPLRQARPEQVAAEREDGVTLARLPTLEQRDRPRAVVHDPQELVAHALALQTCVGPTP